MRRKSERTATKKSKASPEKKEEKSKRTRTRRRKQSSSSENDSHDEESPVREVESVAEPEKNPPPAPAKEDHLDEGQDQIWRVKTSEGSGDVGEIQKLKICLTRPPSTPERIDRSPRSKRKHSRATSSSDTPSVEGMDEKKEKKTKHRKRIVRDKDDGEKNDSHGEDNEEEIGREAAQVQQKSSSEISRTEKSSESISKDKESPISTTNEDNEGDQTVADSSQKEQECIETTKDNESQGKASDADTTTASPKEDTKVATPMDNISDSKSEEQKQLDSHSKSSTNVDTEEVKTSERKRTISVEKSEVLEIHAEESKCESSDNEVGQSNEEHKEDSKTPQEEPASEQSSSMEPQVSKNEEIDSRKSKTSESSMAINELDVVESSNTSSKEIKEEKTQAESDNKTVDVKEKVKDISDSEVQHAQKIQNSDSVQSIHESVTNGQPTPVVSRKRRWGSRSSKLTTQKSITISTDILKDIIPDVKPVEFDEVIEERKHKREREVTEKVYRPILPKIVIDNTDNIEKKKDQVDKEKETKPRDLASNRKISIIKDNDSIITRPPSPPRNKQSCILYITNLVRPFTLTQLKNLLQRTGKIVENGFWIDRIKSKCFVQYESEDHAVETRHALHGVTWPVSNPKTLQVDFSTEEAFEKAKTNEETDTVPVSKPGTVEDWLREQDMKRERGELDQPWERKTATREWDLGKNEKDKDKEKVRLEERPIDKRRRRSPEKTPEPARKFKKKEEEAPAKLLDDLFRKTKATPCIYWLPLSAETIAIKEEQRRQHMAEHERRLQELRRTHRRH